MARAISHNLLLKTHKKSQSFEIWTLQFLLEQILGNIYACVFLVGVFLYDGGLVSNFSLKALAMKGAAIIKSQQMVLT